jgi:hypothetical protein
MSLVSGADLLALAYYAGHRAELDRDIERRLGNVERLQREGGTSALRDRLKAKGLI